MEKTSKLELTAEESVFLDQMTQLPESVRAYGPREEFQKYLGSKDSYTCDPCEACGPDSCAPD